MGILATANEDLDIARTRHREGPDFEAQLRGETREGREGASVASFIFAVR
jgi:hypothetical protein